MWDNCNLAAFLSPAKNGGGGSGYNIKLHLLMRLQFCDSG